MGKVGKLEKGLECLGKKRVWLGCKVEEKGLCRVGSESKLGGVLCEGLGEKGK